MTKNFAENVSQGFNRVMKVFSYKDPFDNNLFYVRYRKGSQEFVGSANGKDGPAACREFMLNNPGVKVTAYRRFSMHTGLTQQWKSFGGN